MSNKVLVDPNKLCMGCMRVLDDLKLPCPDCGFSMDAYAENEKCLQPYEILNGKYLVGKVIGKGGFGITYIGWDFYQGKKIAIKEYFPMGVASRTVSINTNVVTENTPEVQQEYRAGLEAYMDEAKNLSEFYDLEGIVSVRDFFYGNRTAYIIMEYIDGIHLKRFAQIKGGVLEPKMVLYLVKPVIKALAIIHKKDIIHRDISPDNIMLDSDGKVKLIDFGAAKNYDNATKGQIVVLKYGYAPIEQYEKNGCQGPWTDIYSLCATIYFLIVGKKIPEAKKRLEGEPLILPSEVGIVWETRQEQAIVKGLAIQREDRYLCMEDLYFDLYNEHIYPEDKVVTEIVQIKQESVQESVQKVPNVFESDERTSENNHSVMHYIKRFFREEP